MSQSSKMALVLLLGFVVFIVVRGEAPKYLAVIGLGSSSTTPTTQA